MDHGGEAFIGFVVACGDAAECLDVAEEVFDEVAPAVDLEIARDGLCAVGFGRDDRDRAAIVQQGAQRIDVEGLSARSAPNWRPSMIGSTPTLSWRWPGMRMKRTKLPSASTSARILVVKPPRERPMA